MAGEPAGRGPKETCLATWAKARLPSKPPVFSGGGASSAGFGWACGGAVVTALMKGASLAVGCGLSALALQPWSARNNATPRSGVQARATVRQIFFAVKF